MCLSVPHLTVLLLRADLSVIYLSSPLPSPVLAQSRCSIKAGSVYTLTNHRQLVGSAWARSQPPGCRASISPSHLACGTIHQSPSWQQGLLAGDGTQQRPAGLLQLLGTFILALTGAESGLHGASALAASPLPCPPLSVYWELLWGTPAGKRLGREQWVGGRGRVLQLQQAFCPVSAS